MSAPIRPVALFDLDGTLLPWDTQKLFCHYVLQRHPQRRLYLLAFVPMLPFAAILGSEGLKRVFLSFLWGIKEAEVADLARGFAEQWLPARAWTEMLEKINAHRLRGDLTILISASPEPYVKEIGRILGFDLSFGTQMEFPAQGLPLFPDLVNNKGQTKVDRLHEILDSSYFQGAQLKQAHGYTDSTADLPMLTLCQTATVVNPSPRLREIAEKNGWQILILPRPWKNNLQRYWYRLKSVTGF